MFKNLQLNFKKGIDLERIIIYNKTKEVCYGR